MDRMMAASAAGREKARTWDIGSPRFTRRSLTEGVILHERPGAPASTGPCGPHLRDRDGEGSGGFVRDQGWGAGCLVSFFMTSSMYGLSLRLAYSPGKQVVVRSALDADQALRVTAQRRPLARRVLSMSGKS